MEERENLQIESLKQIEFFDVLKNISGYAISEHGKEIISNLFPDENLEKVNLELEYVSEMMEVISMEDNIPFEGLSDVRQLLHKAKIQNSVLGADNLLELKEFFRTSRLMYNFFSSKDEVYPNLNELVGGLHSNKLLEKHIDDAIDETGDIKDTATRELFRIRKDINVKSARLRSRIDKIIKKSAENDIVQEEFVTIREGRFVLPVKSGHKNHFPGLIHGSSASGATVFIEPSEVIEMNNEIALLQNEEKKEIYKILLNLTGEVGRDAVEFLRSEGILTHLDSIRARALYALEYGGMKPALNNEKYIRLKDIRHPLLVKNKGRKNVIPLSIEFSGEKLGYLISGPNAGGKTVALKSIGLNITMALSGIFPLGECRTDYRVVYSSIGDHQSIENDLSTFSSQMHQLRKILSNCDASSLVLADEIGSGTDPQEGGALAASILESFINVKLFFIATTHQSSLKTFALNRKEIENASLEFDEKRLMPTYHFLAGIPGNSYAFFLARNIGLSDHVLERAEDYIGEKQKELEEGINVLQKYKGEISRLRREAEEYKTRAEDLLEKYKAKYGKIQERREDIISEAKLEARNLLKDANKLIEKAIREVREEKRAIKEIKTEFEEEKKKIAKEQPKPGKVEIISKDAEIVVGSIVNIRDTSGVGTVLEINEKNSNALVEANGLKFRLPISQLHLTDKKPESKKHSTADYIQFNASSRIDVRGYRADEAVRNVDNFISEALAGGINHLTIVHGKGTGSLRNAIQEFLKYHHHVVKFRNGELVEGGDGVTIVEL